MYSVFLRGGGGKGVATGAGIVLALVPWIFIIALGVFLVLLLTTRKVSVASLAAALTFAVLHDRLRRADLVRDPGRLRRAGRDLRAPLATSGASPCAARTR